MTIKFNPVSTWIKYGLADLYFGSRNQNNYFLNMGLFYKALSILRNHLATGCADILSEKSHNNRLQGTLCCAPMNPDVMTAIGRKQTFTTLRII